MQGTVKSAVFRREKRFSQKRVLAEVAAEAGARCVPMEAIVGHLTLVDPDGSTAFAAVLGVQGFEAGAAVRLTFAGHVPMTSKAKVTLRAHEVLRMPTTTLSLGPFVRKDNLQR